MVGKTTMDGGGWGGNIPASILIRTRAWRKTTSHRGGCDGNIFAGFLVCSEAAARARLSRWRRGVTLRVLELTGLLP
jgi:hypothetical protein